MSALNQLPARQGIALELPRGASLTVVNTHGGQVVDTWAFARGDMGEFLSMEHSRIALLRLTPVVGNTMVSNRREAMLSLIEDTTDGTHDTLMAACDAARYRQLGAQGYHRNCADNLIEALDRLGLRPIVIPSPLNLFMNVPVAADATLRFVQPTCPPGSHVTLRAEKDLIVALSACPQDLTAVNGHQPSEVHYVVRR